MSPQKSTSPRACSIGLPISFTTIAASASRRSTWSPPRRVIFPARSATEREVSASRASQALAIAASSWSSEISGYSSSVSPVAGLTTVYMLTLIHSLSARLVRRSLLRPHSTRTGHVRSTRSEEQLARLASGRGHVTYPPDELHEPAVDVALRRDRPDAAAPQRHRDGEEPTDERVACLLQRGSLHLPEAVQAQADVTVDLRDPQLRSPALHRRSLRIRADVETRYGVAIFSCASASAAFSALTFLPSASPTTFFRAWVIAASTSSAEDRG